MQARAPSLGSSAFVVLWRAEAKNRTRGVVHMAVVFLTLILTVVPWTLRNKQVSGHFVPISTNLGINLLVGHEPSATGRYSDDADYWQMVRDSGR